VEMARTLGLKFGVVVNRSDIGDREVWNFCTRQAIPILAEIPHNRAVAEAYSRGQLAAAVVPEFGRRIRLLWETLGLQVRRLKQETSRSTVGQGASSVSAARPLSSQQGERGG